MCSGGKCKDGCDDGFGACDGACIDLQTDIDNCGGCDKKCAPFAAASAECQAGVCTVLSCLDGFVNADGLGDNGCECVQQNDGVELCNALDDDCNGLTDDDPPFDEVKDRDVHLQPGSPAIDTGDPPSEYCLEPQPNGGRINPGYWGNTEEATSVPSAIIGACN